MKRILELSDDIPLVWYQILARGGAAADPPGREGTLRHAALLARRGAGDRSRADIDRALDELGATLEVVAGRDSIGLRGVCLSRHVDDVVSIAADILARPAMDPDEHRKLLVETRGVLDELRDDDAALAQRYFARDFGGPAAYARTAIGTEDSLDAIDLDDVRAAYRRAVVPDNLVVAFAGDVDEVRACALADRLAADLPTDPPPALPDVAAEPAAGPTRALVVDKPDRAQVQCAIGHVGPRYGTPEFDALIPVETVFGGTFTSRLMQELRVRRGWTYGAGCQLGRARGNLWFRVAFASAEAVAADAVARAIDMIGELARDGITDDELAFAKGHLRGAWPFSIATPRARAHLRAECAVYGLDDDYALRFPDRIAAVTAAAARDAIAAWLRPASLVTVAVATADRFALPGAAVEPFTSY